LPYAVNVVVSNFFRRILSRGNRTAVIGSGGNKAAPTFPSIYKDAIVRCLTAGNMTWVENAFFFGDYPTLRESADGLRHLVVRHLLKEAGDVAGAASILEALSTKLDVPEDPHQRFFRLLCRYVANELDAGPRRMTGAQSVISVAVWGDAYIDRFDRYCMASLAAEGNIPALKARGGVTLLIHTAARDVSMIKRLESLRRLGIKVRIWTLPDELLRLAEGELKYWLLGGIQSLHLFYAARLGANFLPVFPDGFYSARYFASLLELVDDGADAVFLSAFRASREGMAGDLKQFARRGAYAVPADKLIELALRHVDSYVLNCLIDPASETLPRHRLLSTFCGDYIEMRSPHYNAALIRNSVLAQPRYLMTLDSEIDKVLPSDSSIHFRTVEDDYFATELVNDSSDPWPLVGYDDYASFFIEHANSAHLRFERSPYRIAVRPEWLGFQSVVSPEDAARCFDRICGLVEGRMKTAEQNIERPEVVLRLLESVADMGLSRPEAELVARASEAVRKRMAKGPTL
jgi:hypothetical protein